jgi:hypothetical protein
METSRMREEIDAEFYRKVAEREANRKREFEGLLHEAEHFLVRRFELRPNQILIFRTDLMLDKEQASTLRDRLREMLPKDVQFALLTGGIDVTIAAVDQANGNRVQRGVAHAGDGDD